jgi:hypothetical protein
MLKGRFYPGAQRLALGFERLAADQLELRATNVGATINPRLGPPRHVPPSRETNSKPCSLSVRSLPADIHDVRKMPTVKIGTPRGRSGNHLPLS